MVHNKGKRRQDRFFLLHRLAALGNAPIDLIIGPKLNTLIVCDTVERHDHMMKSSYPTVAICSKFPILSEFQ